MYENISEDELRELLDQKQAETTAIASELRKREELRQDDLLSYVKGIGETYSGAWIQSTPRNLCIVSFEGCPCTNFQVGVKIIQIHCDFDDPFALRAAVTGHIYSTESFKNFLADPDVTFIQKEDEWKIDSILLGLLHGSLTIEKIVEQLHSSLI